jgi:hypothetical protein
MRIALDLEVEVKTARQSQHLVKGGFSLDRIVRD